MGLFVGMLAATAVVAQEQPNDSGIYEWPAEPGGAAAGDRGGTDADRGLDDGVQPYDPSATTNPGGAQTIPGGGERDSARDEAGAAGSDMVDGAGGVLGDDSGIRTPIEYGVSQVRPRRGLRIGDMDFSFFLASSLNVDSNIYLNDNEDGFDPLVDPTAGDDGDVVFLNVPGVRLDWFLGDHHVAAEYRMEIQSFADHSEQNQINNFYDVQAQLNFNEVYFNIGDRLQTLSDPVDLAISNKVERLDHFVNVAVGMRHQRLHLELGYQHESLDFENTGYQHIDHEEDYITAFLGYQLNSRWELTVDYRYGERDYQENVINDSHVNVIRGGVRGFVTPNVEFFTKVGFEEVTPEDGALIDDENNYHGVATSSGLSWRLSPRTSLTGRYTRTTEYGSFSTYEIVNDVELSGRHQLTEDIRIGFNVWLRDQDPSKGPRTKQWGVRTGGDWSIRPWWSVSAEGIFMWQDSSSSGDLFVQRTDGHVLGPAVSVGSQSFDGAQFLLSSIIAF